MSRPIKSTGLDYFPHDCDAMSDEKIETLTTLYGSKGYMFYFGLLERIYRSENLSLHVSAAETHQILSRKLCMTKKEFSAILKTALKIGCFDAEKYKTEHILTSAGVKKRAKPALYRREKMRLLYQKRISAAETSQKNVRNITETHQNYAEKIISDVKNGSKAKQSKAKQSVCVGKPAVFTPPTPVQVSEYAKSIDYNLDAQYFCDTYAAKNWKVGRNQIQDWQATIRVWQKGDQKKQKGTGIPQISCCIDRQPGYKFQLDVKNAVRYLCKECLEAFNKNYKGRAWGKIPIETLERYVLEGKAEK